MRNIQKAQIMFDWSIPNLRNETFSIQYWIINGCLKKKVHSPEITRVSSYLFVSVLFQTL